MIGLAHYEGYLEREALIDLAAPCRQNGWGLFTVTYSGCARRLRLRLTYFAFERSRWHGRRRLLHLLMIFSPFGRLEVSNGKFLLAIIR